MVVNTDESRLRTIEQWAKFLKVMRQVAFTAHRLGVVGEDQRYEHISRVLTRLDDVSSREPSTPR